MAFPSSHVRDNPWWRGAEGISEDPDLRRLRDQPVRYEHPLPFDLTADAVYTLRGPRQVGKTTLLKRIIEPLLAGGSATPRDLFYLDVEGAGITESSALTEIVQEYLAWSRSSRPDARKYLLLDEVTGVPDWGTSIRVLHRRGRLEGVTAIVTGSHALDLLRGGETAPGRRGEALGLALDWIMMPFDFRDYVSAHDPQLAEAMPTFHPGEDPARVHAVCAEIAFQGADELRALLHRYFLSGGYPHAMAAEQEREAIPHSIYELYRQAMVGQIRRAGHREAYFRELVSWVADGRLGREFSWRDVSGDTHIGSKDTVRAYMEDAEAMFLWHILYRAQSATDLAPALRSPKKLYPVDPFAWHAMAGWTRRERDPWSGAVQRMEQGETLGGLAESVVADHLRRRVGSGLLYHRTTRGSEEIDFVLSTEGGPAYLEVKFREEIRGRDWRALADRGGGVLVSRDHLDLEADASIAIVPLHTFLVGLSGDGTLHPVRR